jgi:hypothetical protein
MPTRNITRQATNPLAAAATPTSAPIYVDSDDNKLKMIPAGSGTTEVTIHESSTLPITTLNIGAVNGATLSAVEYGDGILHQTVITITALPLTVLDTGTGVGVKIYDFPAGGITILGATGTIAETTTSTLSSTWHSNVAYTWGVGTVTQAAGTTLSTTQCNILPGTAGTAGVTSTTVSVAAVANLAGSIYAATSFNGVSTAIDAFFNVATAAADIDADASTLWTGTVTISWLFNQDV